MRKVIVIIYLLLNLKIGLCQSASKLEFNEKQRQYVYSACIKNFLLFQANRTIEANKEFIVKEEINRIDFGRYFLDTNSFYDLKMDIVNIPRSPFNEYVLISVSNYNTGYTRLFGKDAENNFGSHVGIIPGNLIGNFKKSMDLSLIAYKLETNEIIYIAGPIFTQNIWSWFFKQNELEIDKLRDYIAFKYYNFRPSNITIQPGMKGAVFFLRRTRSIIL